jgi:TP901 family phage tail tape measure protein
MPLSEVTSVATTRLVVDGKGVESGLVGVDSALGRTVKRMNEVVKANGYLWLSLTRIATYTGIFSFFGAVGKLLKDNIELNTRLAEVSTLIDSANKKQVASWEAVKQQLVTLDPYLGSTIELTRGMYEIMSAGVNEPVQALKLLVTSAKYAKAGLTDLATSASILTSVMKAYNLRAEDMRQVSDVLFSAVQEGKFHVSDLNEAMGKVLPTAATMGVGIDEVSAALAVISQRGLSASEAATGLNRALLSFLKPQQQVAKYMEKQRIETGMTAFATKSFTQVLKDLNEIATRHADVYSKIITRERGLRAMFILSGVGLEQYFKMLEKVRAAMEGQGIVAQAYGKIIGTVGEEMKAVATKFQQAAYAAWGTQSALAAVVKILGSLGLALFKNMDVLTLIGIAWFTLGHAIVKAKLMMDAAYTGMLMKNLMLQAQQAATMKQLALVEAHTIKLGVAMKGAAGLAAGLTTALTGIVVAVVSFAAVRAAMRLLTEDVKRQQDALDKYSTAIRNVSDRLSFWIQMKRELVGGGPELRQILDVEVIKEATAQLRGLGDAVKIEKALWKELSGGVKLALGPMAALSLEVDKMGRALYHNIPLTAKQLQLLKEYAASVGLTEGVLNRLTRQWAENEEWAAKVQARLRGLAITFRDISGAMAIWFKAPMELAKEFPKEKLLEWQKLISMAMAPSDKYTEQQIKAYFDAVKIDYEAAKPLFKDIAATLSAALALQPDLQKQAEWEEGIRGLLLNYKKRVMDAATATLHAQMALAAWKNELVPTDEKMNAFVDTNREWFIQLEASASLLPKVLHEGLIPFFEYIHKQTREENLAKMAERASDALDSMLDVMANAAEKEQTLLNELFSERYNDVVAQAKAEYNVKKRQLDDYLQAVRENHGNLLIAYMIYATTLAALEEKVGLARQVAVKRQFQEYLDDLKDTLRLDFATTTQKIRAAHALYDEAIHKAVELAGTDVELLEILLQGTENFFEQYIKSILKGRTALGDLIITLRAVQQILSSLSSALRGLVQDLGITEGAIYRFAEVLDALSEGVNGVVQGLEAIQIASTMSGALASLAKVAGVIGIIISVVVTLIKVFNALFGKKQQTEAEKMAEAIGKVQRQFKYLGRMSDSVAQRFVELSKKVGEANAKLLLLGDIMRDVGIDSANFELFMVDLMESLVTMAKAAADPWSAYTTSMEEMSEAIGSAFSEMIKYAERWGREGDKWLVSFIQKVRELGLSIKEVDDYVYEWLDTASEGLLTLINSINPLGKSMAEMQDELAGYYKELAEVKFTNIDRAEELLKSIEETNQAIADFTTNLEANQAALRRATVLALTVFNAMLAQGRSLYEVVEAMREPLTALRDKYRQLGMEGDASVAALLKIIDVVDANKELFEAIEANRQILLALGNTGFLTQEAIGAVAENAKSFYDKLIAAGIDSQTALQMISPTLADLVYYAAQYGITLDDATLALIEQAKEAGVYHDKVKTVQEVLETGFQGLIDKIDELILVLGGVPDSMHDVDDSWDEYNKGARDAIDNVMELQNDINNGKWAIPGTGRNGGVPEAQFGIREVGGNQLVNAHSGESILPRNLSEALRRFFGGRALPAGQPGADGVIENNVYIDGQLVYKKLVPYLRKGGKYGDYEIAGDGVF